MVLQYVFQHWCWWGSFSESQLQQRNQQKRKIITVGAVLANMSPFTRFDLLGSSSPYILLSTVGRI